MWLESGIPCRGMLDDILLYCCTSTRTLLGRYCIDDNHVSTTFPSTTILLVVRARVSEQEIDFSVRSTSGERVSANVDCKPAASAGCPTRSLTPPHAPIPSADASLCSSSSPSNGTRGASMTVRPPQPLGHASYLPVTDPHGHTRHHRRCSSIYARGCQQRNAEGTRRSRGEIASVQTYLSGPEWSPRPEPGGRKAGARRTPYATAPSLLVTGTT